MASSSGMPQCVLMLLVLALISGQASGNSWIWLSVLALYLGQASGMPLCTQIWPFLHYISWLFLHCISGQFSGMPLCTQICLFLHYISGQISGRPQYDVRYCSHN
jgi:hypothetical protein